MSCATDSAFFTQATERRTQRIPCQRPVRLRTSDNREVCGMCTDISGHGIGLDLDRILRVGQRLELLLGDETSIPLLVIYRMGNHYGLAALADGERLMELLPLQ